MWFHNLISRNRNLFRTFLLSVLVACGAAYFWHLERVPYTNRFHFVLHSTSYEKKQWESTTFETFIDSKYEGKRLPPLHPSSIRVQRIGKDIVEAAIKGLRKEEESLIIKNFKKLGKMDYYQIPQYEWEFVVIDDPQYETSSAFLGGKIGISTVMLDTLESDAEIAAIIAHEVGHTIARHLLEHWYRRQGLIILTTMFLYLAISKFVEMVGRHSAEEVYKSLLRLLLKSFLLLLIPAISRYLIWLPYSRRNELEADYIGLILMASAGYDPRVAPHVAEKIGSFSQWKEYVSRYPCGKTRAQLLSLPRVMEEALSIYREVQSF